MDYNLRQSKHVQINGRIYICAYNDKVGQWQTVYNGRIVTYAELEQISKAKENGKPL